jgi:hypothetical protein
MVAARWAAREIFIGPRGNNPQNSRQGIYVAQLLVSQQAEMADYRLSNEAMARRIQRIRRQ